MTGQSVRNSIYAFEYIRTFSGGPRPSPSRNVCALLAALYLPRKGRRIESNPVPEAGAARAVLE